MGRREENIQHILELAGEGKNAYEIAIILNLKEETIRDYAGERKISLPETNPVGRPRIDRERKQEEIQYILAQGKINSREELAKLVGISPKSLWKYDLPSHLEPYRWKPAWDEKIAEGESAKSIGKLVGVSKQAIEEYICHSGQQTFWKEKNLERKEREILSEKEWQCTLEQIAGQIWNVVERKATEQGWAYERALEYCRKSQRRRGIDLIPFEKLIKTFTVYEEAEQRGEKPSLKELAWRAGFSHPSSISRIYKITRVKPFYG